MVLELDEMVTRMLFENYGVEKYYDSHMESTTHSLGILKYTEPQKTGTNEGLPNHTDKQFTSILHQNGVKGLEIKTKDGEWIGFDPSPSNFIFLAGDALQVGYYFLILYICQKQMVFLTKLLYIDIFLFLILCHVEIFKNIIRESHENIGTGDGLTNKNKLV